MHGSGIRCRCRCRRSQLVVRSPGAKWRFAAGICDGYGVRADGCMTCEQWCRFEEQATEFGARLDVLSDAALVSVPWSSGYTGKPGAGFVSSWGGGFCEMFRVSPNGGSPKPML